jgi:hypothetical protein
MLDADGDPVTGETCDSEISKDGDTGADCTNEGTEITFTTATNKGMYYLTLTATELTCSIAAITIYASNSKATPIVLYPIVLPKIEDDTAQAGAAGTITLHSGAKAIDEFYNGCIIYLDGGTGSGQVRMIDDYVGSTKIASVTPDWSTTPDNTSTFQVYVPLGNMHVLLAKMPSSAYLKGTADADGGMDSSDKADVNTEADTALTDYDPPTKTEMDTAHALLATESKQDTIDTVVDAIKAVLLPDAGALSDLAAILTDTGTTLPATLSTIAGYIDTEIAAIKAVTDNLPNSGALSDLATILVDTNELQADWANGGRLDLLLDAIKAITDALPDSGALNDLAAILVDTGTTLPATLATIAGYLDTEIAAILADTGELQTDWANGGRLDLLIDAIKAKTDLRPSGVAKNVEFTLPFFMALSSDHVTPATGKTVTVQISKDGGAFAGATNSPAEIANGWYKIVITSTEMNAAAISVKVTETDCDQTNLLLATST